MIFCLGIGCKCSVGCLFCTILYLSNSKSILYYIPFNSEYGLKVVSI